MARRGVSFPIDSSPELQRKLVDELFHGSTDDFAKAYFEKVADNVARNRTDIIGHFDLVTKYSEIPETESYIDAAVDGVRECMKYCDLFELNTGAIARGLTTLPYPAGFILDEIRECGGRIIRDLGLPLQREAHRVVQRSRGLSHSARIYSKRKRLDKR